MSADYVLKSAAAQKLGEGEDISKKPALQSLMAAMAAIEKEQQPAPEVTRQTQPKASFGSELRASIAPQYQSISNLEKIQQAPLESPSGEAGGRKGILDSLLNFSKTTAENSGQLVTLTQQMKALQEKAAEDNKELLGRLLSANEAMRASMEEAMREAGRSGKGGPGGSAGFGDEGAGGEGGKGGGIPDWVKNVAGIGAAGYGAKKVYDVASKTVGRKTAAKATSAVGGFARGAGKAGSAALIASLAYSMSSEDIQKKLAEYGIDENAIAAAGLAGTLGYGAYSASKNMAATDKAIKEGAVDQKIQKIDEAQKSGKQAERVAEAKAAKQAAAEAPKVEPKTDPTKGAAEAAKQKFAKEAGEEVAEGAGKKAAKTAGMDAVKKAIGKVASSKAVTTVAKKIPLLGAIAGLGAAVSRAWSGDYTGAGLEVTSGVLGATGAGAVPSLAIDAGLLARDVYQELYDVFPENDDPDLRTDRFNEVTAAVTDYVKGLVSSNEGQGESKTEGLKPLDDMSGGGATSMPSETPKVEPSSPPKFRSGASDSMTSVPSVSGSSSNISPQSIQDLKTEAISKSPTQPSGAPIIVNKGGDTINNITNASGGGSGGAAGSPSRIPNPWDNQVFGNPWAAYF